MPPYPVDLNTHPPFADLPAEERVALLAQGQEREVGAGEVLFYEGDRAEELALLVAGKVTLSWAGQARGEVGAGALVDAEAALGDLPHRVKAVAAEACTLLCWSVEALWESPTFGRAAGRFLAQAFREAQSRLDEVAAPIHYGGVGVELRPGPFRFHDVTLLFAFCEADRDALQVGLPEGLSLLAWKKKDRAPLLVAPARFPRAYPEDDPEAWFAYDETTFFVPVRRGRRVGLYVPSIYPSAWEPILLGREIYGFPKQLGKTHFGRNRASLVVDGQVYANLQWDGLERSGERRLVGALFDWLALPGGTASAAFSVGETMRAVMRLPPFRRVEVYNHKRIAAADSSHEAPRYAVDQLTRAVFGVLRWHQIAKMRDPVLEVVGGPLREARVVLQEAYSTTLDMRLSRGQVVRDYIAE